jgi:hypothetical protein
VAILLGIFVVVRALPGDPGAVRIGGLAALWWYGGVLAPLTAWLLAAFLGGRRGPAAESPRERDDGAAPDRS